MPGLENGENITSESKEVESHPLVLEEQEKLVLIELINDRPYQSDESAEEIAHYNDLCEKLKDKNNVSEIVLGEWWEARLRNLIDNELIGADTDDARNKNLNAVFKKITGGEDSLPFRPHEFFK